MRPLTDGDPRTGNPDIITARIDKLAHRLPVAYRAIQAASRSSPLPQTPARPPRLATATTAPGPHERPRPRPPAPATTIHCNTPYNRLYLT